MTTQGFNTRNQPARSAVMHAPAMGQTLAQVRRGLAFVACLGIIVSLPYMTGRQDKTTQERMAGTGISALMEKNGPTVIVPVKTSSASQIAQLR